jgi:hypothetical protein
VSENGTGYLDSIEVDCEPGYELQSGDKTRTCQANKTWSGAVAVCVGEFAWLSDHFANLWWVPHLPGNIIKIAIFFVESV